MQLVLGLVRGSGERHPRPMGPARALRPLPVGGAARAKA